MDNVSYIGRGFSGHWEIADDKKLEQVEADWVRTSEKMRYENANDRSNYLPPIRFNHW